MMYQSLLKKIETGQTLLLDGAIGTQLQNMGVAMDNTAWAAEVLNSNPDVVLRMHQQYIETGVDIITTNTFSSARHNLQTIGLADETRELNHRAVTLAIEARNNYQTDRPIAIAGSISHFGIMVDGEYGEAAHQHTTADAYPDLSQAQARQNIREQAEILVDSGVDFLLLESTGNMTQRKWLLEGTDHLNIPRWLGYRCRLDTGSDIVRVGYSSTDRFDQNLDLINRHNIEGIAIFHSLIDDTTAGLAVLKDHWNGIIAAYPEAGRNDYTATEYDPLEQSNISPQELPGIFNQWIASGVQVVGGCCGINLEYYDDLKSSID
jgi:S-methylmethionine-dependent homocysteine/selenocysteine methylase